MMVKSDGGPAFPTGSVGDGGMTLRQYYAAKAGAGVLSGILSHDDFKINPDRIAKSAFLIADAMIREGGE